MTTVHWFRRDLRARDHEALAAVDGPVLGLFVLDDRLLRPAGSVRKAYLARTLAALDDELGGRLLVCHGRPDTVLRGVTRAVGAERVAITADHGRYGSARDDAVRRALTEDGVTMSALGSPYAVPPGTITKPDQQPYAVFAPWYRRWAELAAGASVDPCDIEWSTPPEIAGVQRYSPGDLGRRDPPEAELPEAGSAAALTAWRRFLDDGLETYGSDRDRPDLDRSSRLSPYLKWGAIHPDRLLHDLVGRSDAGAEAFRRELAFREFYADLWWHHPDSATRSLDVQVDAMRWDDDGELLSAWQQGRTGYPYIDAGMRQLRAEGWMHNRVRMAVASFLIKDLHLPWQVGARHFLDHLVDGDTASNSQGWQWVAGSGAHAAPFHRVFNPIGQGEKHDPRGDYVRRYVPELRAISGAAVHRPWDLPDGPPTGYPPPIVDHATEREVALHDWRASRIGR